MAQHRSPVRATATRERAAAPRAALPTRAVAAASAGASLQQRISQQGAQALIARVANDAAAASAGAMRVSSPGDAAELEAESTAKKVMQSAAAPVAARDTAGAIAREAAGPPAMTPTISADIASSAGLGAPMPARVLNFMEPRFKADFSRVRIHTGARAAQLSSHLNARAFTVGNNIFFAKDQFKPETPQGQELIAHELAHTIQQGSAVQRSEAPDIRASAPAQVQRDWLPSPIEYAVDKANLIPGFRLFTLVLGLNPINMAKVVRSASNLLRALLELLPGGALLTEALDNSGVFAKAGAWVGQRVATLGMAASSIKLAIDKFIASLDPGDILNLAGVWDRAKHIVTGPIDRIIGLGKGLIGDLVQFVKDAMLQPLARLAEKLPNWQLLTAVLGKNPITGEPVPRRPEILIGGFMKLIGQEDVWENMQKAGAVARAWSWFQGAMAGALGFVRQLPTLAMSALRALTIQDIVLLPRAFGKVAVVFGTFVGDFIGWAGKAVWTLLEIVFDAISPGAFRYIKRAGSALRNILKNPLAFVGNLVKAAKLGFLNFAGNFLGHLKRGLMDWLVGALPGVYVPKALALGEIGKFAFSALGIGWQSIRQKLVKSVGEPAVAAMEAGFDIVKSLVREGPAAAWEMMKEQLAETKKTVLGGITDFVVDMVVRKAVPKLVAMFIPGAGFISAIVSIYDTVMVFVEKIAKIAQVVTGFVDSIVTIAGGAVGAAAGKVESVLAGMLSLAINFMAEFAGLGNAADKVKGVIGKVRGTMDRGIDAIVGWIEKMAKKLFPNRSGRDKDYGRTPQQKQTDLRLGIGEATTLLQDVSLSPAAVKKRLPAIRTKFRMLTLEVVSDGVNHFEETSHIHGAINPDGTGAKVIKKLAQWPPVKVGDTISHPASPRVEKVLEIDETHIKYTHLGDRANPVKHDRPGFMEGWINDKIRLVPKGATQQREVLYAQFPNQGKVVEAIMRRRELRKAVPGKRGHAHHKIPIEVLQSSGVIARLIQEGDWNFNGEINGVRLTAKFHGSHASYNQYAINKIESWAAVNMNAPVSAIKQFVETELLKDLDTIIAAAKLEFRRKGVTLDQYIRNGNVINWRQ